MLGDEAFPLSVASRIDGGGESFPEGGIRVAVAAEDDAGDDYEILVRVIFYRLSVPDPLPLLAVVVCSGENPFFKTPGLAA